MNSVATQIEAKRAAILRMWRSDYQSSTGKKFLPFQEGGGRFTQPVAYLHETCANDVLSWLEAEGEEGAFPSILQQWGRLQALETTDEAEVGVSFLSLKEILRKCVGDNLSPQDYQSIDKRIDALVEAAVEVWRESRELLETIRQDEIKRSEALMNRRLQRRRQSIEGDGS